MKNFLWFYKITFYVHSDLDLDSVIPVLPALPFLLNEGETFLPQHRDRLVLVGDFLFRKLSISARSYVFFFLSFEVSRVHNALREGVDFVYGVVYGWSVPVESGEKLAISTSGARVVCRWSHRWRSEMEVRDVVLCHHGRVWAGLVNRNEVNVSKM